MTEPIKLPPLPGCLTFYPLTDRVALDEYICLAVEQATADLRAMLDRAIERLHAAEAALPLVKDERDEACAELARLTTLRPESEWENEAAEWWVQQLSGEWSPVDPVTGTHWTPLPDVKEADHD
jgi:hypothetical protein